MKDMDLVLFRASQPGECETWENISPEKAISAFDAFDWINEVKIYSERKWDGPPSLSVWVSGEQEMISVSAYRDRSGMQFLSSCHFPGQVEKLFGLIKYQGTVKLDRMHWDKLQARRSIELLVGRDYEGLRALYA
jgi:hypothetical protein